MQGLGVGSGNIAIFYCDNIILKVASNSYKAQTLRAQCMPVWALQLFRRPQARSIYTSTLGCLHYHWNSCGYQWQRLQELTAEPLKYKLVDNFNFTIPGSSHSQRGLLVLWSFVSATPPSWLAHGYNAESGSPSAIAGYRLRLRLGYSTSIHAQYTLS